MNPGRPSVCDDDDGWNRIVRIMQQQKTLLARPETTQPGWYVVDGDDQIVGRLATKIAMVLMGKHKPTYTPHVDTGDFVIVINAHKVRFSGKPVSDPRNPNLTRKMLNKTYDHYTGYAGGLKSETAASLWERYPERILQEAVRRMLPKNKLARKMLSKLKLYNAAEHPHQAQEPKPMPAHLMPCSKCE